MVTGATSGIGRDMALGLAESGASLHLVGRDQARLDQVTREIEQCRQGAVAAQYRADLSVRNEVERVAEEFLARNLPLHVLVNNAGAVFDQRRESADGIEMTLALNHFAYFILSLRLLEALKAAGPAQIINTASNAYTMAKSRLNFDDLQARNEYSAFKQYAYSKLANIHFTRRLARELTGSDVSVQAFHPGVVATGFGHNGGTLMKAAMWIMKPFSRNPAKGADTGLWLARQPLETLENGGYYFDRKPESLKSEARNDEDAERLWSWSLAMIGGGEEAAGVAR